MQITDLWAVVKLEPSQSLDREDLCRRGGAFLAPFMCIKSRHGNSAQVFADMAHGVWGTITDNNLNDSRYKIGEEGNGGHILMIFNRRNADHLIAATVVAERAVK